MPEEWFRTWFDTNYYHLLYNRRDDIEARQFIDALLAFLAPVKSARFLDVACGRGRHSLQLANHGFHTTGIDLSENSIRSAKEIPSDLLEFHVQDIRTPYTCGTFDYALNLFTSFGYFDSYAEHQLAISNIYDALKPQGVFVLDYMNSDYVRRHIESTELIEINSIEFHIKRSIADGKIVKHITVQDGTSSYTYYERVQAFSPTQLTELIEGAGFEVKSIHGDYQMGVLDADMPRVIIIAQKK